MSENWNDVTNGEAARIAARIIVDNYSGCWLWQGAKIRNGYGVISCSPRGKSRLVHRAAYIYCRGMIEKNLCVLHRCDVRHCVNPDHLFIGTYQDNARDRNAKGRNATKVGQANGRSKITHEQVIAIKTDLANGASLRYVANKYMIGKTQVCRIRDGISWKHVTT